RASGRPERPPPFFLRSISAPASEKSIARTERRAFVTPGEGFVPAVSTGPAHAAFDPVLVSRGPLGRHVRRGCRRASPALSSPPRSSRAARSHARKAAG